MNQWRLLETVAGDWLVDTLLSPLDASLPVDISLSGSRSVLPDGNHVDQRPDSVPGRSVFAGWGIDGSVTGKGDSPNAAFYDAENRLLPSSMR